MSAARSPTASWYAYSPPGPARPHRWRAPGAEGGRLKIARVLALGAFVAVLAGCAVGPNYRTPNIPTPGGYAAAASSATAAETGAAPETAPAPVDLATWWRALQDPELDSLIARAINGNPDVLIALDRLQAARVYEAGIIGTVLPEAEA